MLKTVAVSLVLGLYLVCIPSASEAGAKRRNRVIRLPAAKIVCDQRCQESLTLYRTMDAVAAGKLVVCGYQDDRAIWVRKPGEPGECTRVAVPADRAKKRLR